MSDLDIAGIYTITNSVNGSQYVGSSVLISRRWNRHKNNLRKGDHKNPHLQNAWNHYGEEAFSLTVLEVIDEPTKENILNREQYWIDTLRPKYNVCKLAYNTLGLRFKVSKKRTDSHIKKLADTKRGTHLSEEQRAKIGAGQKDCKRNTPEGRAHLSEVMKKRPVRKRTPEERAKLSAIHTGLAWSESRRASYESSKKILTDEEKEEKHQKWLARRRELRAIKNASKQD